MIVRHFVVFLAGCLLRISNLVAEEVPNIGDVEVVEGKGGNYHLVEEDHVLILTRENFHYFILSRPVVLVEFYAPWCTHCQALAPEYSKAAEELKRDNITLAKVDATKEVELAKEFLISGYPSIILFRNGRKFHEYTGQRTSYDIVEYMREKTDPNWKPPTSAVAILASENFTKTIQNSEIILVEFYAPWCRHCKQLEPEYEAAAKQLLPYGIPLAKIDGPREKEIADSLKVAGWPTLKVARKGRIFDYKGPREAAGIVEHMKELAKPPSKLVNSVAEAKSEMDRKEVTIMGFFPEKTDLYQEYMAACQELRGIFTMMHTFDENIINHFDVNPNSVVVFMPEIFQSEYDKPFYEYTRASGNAMDIIEFIKRYSVPLVGQRTKRNEGFKYSTFPMIVVYYDVNFDHQYIKDTQFIRKKVLEVAKSYQLTNLKIAISNEEEYEQELRSLNLADANEDVKVAAFDRNVKFRMDPVDDFDTEDLRKFAATLATGKGRPFFKSQPIPKIQEGPVKTVVADNFVQEIMRVDKDILIEFYAPWCSHCKAFEPVYKKFAKKMAKENPNLLVAKMDATANDLLPIFSEIKGYPTLLFLPAQKKEEFIPYQGKHNIKELREFVDQHSSIFLSDAERKGLSSDENETSAENDDSNSPTREEL